MTQTFGQVLLDDGTLYIALDPNASNPEDAPGQLRERCAAGVRTPYRFECIGEFRPQNDGSWMAYIDASDGGAHPNCVVATDVSRLEAICALWQARHRARSQSIRSNL